MKLSIIIPVYNEANTIKEVLDRVNNVDLSSLGLKKEIVVVDDGSKDGTQNVLLANAHAYAKLIIHEVNKGKGSAIRTGIANSTGDIILIQDADLEYNPDEYITVLTPIIHKKAEVVYGSRFLSQPHSSKQKWAIPSHYLGNKFLSMLTSLLYFEPISDMETCYKAFKKEALNGITLKAERFEFEPEITAKILKKGIRILEVPISYKSRDYKEGKKIKWSDGLIAVWTLIKYRFVN